MAERFVEYLAAVELRDQDRWDEARQALDVLFPDEWLRLLIEYNADNAGLTEHGGSVYGAWLTDKGREWLTRLRP